MSDQHRTASADILAVVQEFEARRLSYWAAWARLDKYGFSESVIHRLLGKPPEERE